MARYQCRIISDNAQIINDEFEAENVEALKAAFSQRGYKLVSFKEKKVSVLNMQIGSKKLSQKSIVLFCRQMSTLLKAGINLIKCFEILMSQNKDKVLQETLQTLSLDIQSGSMLSASMEKMGNRFPQMLVKMVEIGEAAGNLDDIFERMATKYEKDDKIAKKMKSAMIYPVFLLVLALAAWVFMLTSVVPSFVEQFKSSGAPLPKITQIMLDLSDSLKSNWYIYLIVIISIVLIIKFLFTLPNIRKKWAYYVFAKSPVKNSISKIICASLARTLNILIKSGIPIVQSVQYTAKNVTNEYVKACLEEIAVGMQEGKGFSEQLESFNSFPNLFVSMIAIGESSGKLEEMLMKTADYYEGETESAVEQLMAFIQPVMIVVVGALIGVIVVALYAPMFGMYTVIE